MLKGSKNRSPSSDGGLKEGIITKRIIKRSSTVVAEKKLQKEAREGGGKRKYYNLQVDQISKIEKLYLLTLFSLRVALH